MTEAIHNLVGGEWVSARSGRTQQRRNPADQDDVVASYPRMGSEDATAAIDAAREGADVWRATSPVARGRILIDAARLLRKRSEEIVRDVCRENGKTLAEAGAEVGTAANFLEYYGGLGRSGFGTVLPDQRDGVEVTARRVPLGVVVLITPWNDPVVTPARKLSPALACGNAVVLKPSGETPLSAHYLSWALSEAGLPPGVLNVVSGPSSELGPALLGHDAVRAVSFTGSNEVGGRLNKQLAGSNVRLQTELGGKNAAVVLDDADLDRAIATVAAAACGQAGQRCTATSRVIATAQVYDEVLERLVEHVDGLKVGPGTDPDSDVGALVTEAHLQSVLDAVAQARNEGATVEAGGDRMEEGPHARGWFIRPTVLSEVAQDSIAWRRELFGPVISVVRAGSFGEAVSLVEDSPFGLSCGIFTTSLRAAYAFVEAVDTGQVSVNLPTTGWDVHIPFGGFKDSGSPFKEHGTEGLAFYSKVKTVALGYGF